MGAIQQALLAGYGVAGSNSLKWNPSFARSGLTFTLTDRKATVSSQAEGGARSLVPNEQTGLRYFEAVFTGNAGEYHGIGLCNSSWLNTADPGNSGANALACLPFFSGECFKAGSSQGVVTSGFSNGSSVGVAFDATKVWFRRAGVGANWNGGAIGSQNPATATGGITHGLSGNIYVCCRLYQVSGAIQLATSNNFIETPPSGAVSLTF